MSEDRTQAPSKLRRQQARDRGQVAHSPELTGAVGLLAAIVLLGFWGESLATALVAVGAGPLAGTPAVSADPAEVVARLRQLAIGVVWPLVPVVAGSALAAIAAHQAQVQGLWAPGLLAPDLRRLWMLGHGPGLGTRSARGAGALVQAAVVAPAAGG